MRRFGTSKKHLSTPGALAAVQSKVVVLLLLIHFCFTTIDEFCNCSIFYCALLCVHSSFAIILMGKKEQVVFHCLPSWCLVFVM